MKLNLQPEAIKLRKQGYGIADIARKLHIAESTASLWCRKITLTKGQQKELETRTNRKLQKFFRLVEKQKEKREKSKQKSLKLAALKTERLSPRDPFVAGTALYWAEGFKHKAEGRIGFCNSDPEMMKFMIKFLKTCLGVHTKDLSPRLTINGSFRRDAEKIERFWSGHLKLPLSQFTKPFFQKVKLKKLYEHPENYHGVLRIHVRKSSRLLIKMRGYLEGLKLFAQQA